jgi:hypothetical protein
MQLSYGQPWQMQDGGFDKGQWIDMTEASKGLEHMAFNAAWNADVAGRIARASSLTYCTDSWTWSGR